MLAVLRKMCGCFRKQDWGKAKEWYDRAAETVEPDEDGDFDSTLNYPNYQIYEKLAQMVRTGGFNLPKDPQAAGKELTYATEII